MLDGLLGEVLTGLVTAGAFAAFLSTSSGLSIAVAGVLSQDVTGRRFGTHRLSGIAAFRAGAAIAVIVPALVLDRRPRRRRRAHGRAGLRRRGVDVLPAAHPRHLVARPDRRRRDRRARRRRDRLRPCGRLDAGHDRDHGVGRRAPRAAGGLERARGPGDDGARQPRDPGPGARPRRTFHGAAPHARGGRAGAVSGQHPPLYSGPREQRRHRRHRRHRVLRVPRRPDGARRADAVRRTVGARRDRHRRRAERGVRAAARPAPRAPAARDQLPRQPLGAALARCPPGPRALRRRRAARHRRSGRPRGARPAGRPHVPPDRLLRRDRRDPPALRRSLLPRRLRAHSPEPTTRCAPAARWW